jgi:hypothetical protein
LDSAHQIGAEIPFHGVLIVVARCRKSSEKVVGGILKLGNLRMSLPAKQQPEELWTNRDYRSIRYIGKVQKQSSTEF